MRAWLVRRLQAAFCAVTQHDYSVERLVFEAELYGVAGARCERCEKIVLRVARGTPAVEGEPWLL